MAAEASRESTLISPFTEVNTLKSPCITSQAHDPVLDGRGVATGPGQQAHPGRRGGERSARGAAQPHDLEVVLHPTGEEGLENPGHEGALTPSTLTGDGDTSALQSILLFT